MQQKICSLAFFSLFLTIIIFLFHNIAWAQTQLTKTLSLSPNRVRLNDPISVQIAGLPDANATYTLTINSENGNEGFATLNIQTQKGQDCSPPTPSGSRTDVWEKGKDGIGQRVWCTTLPVGAQKFHTYFITIDTSRLGYDPSFPEFVYSIVATGGIQPARTKFTVFTSQGGLSISFDPNHGTADHPVIYEDEPVTVSAKGCSAGKRVNFQWYRGDAIKCYNEDRTDCKSDGSGSGDEHEKKIDDGDPITDNSGVAYFPKNDFGSDKPTRQEEPYLMTAWCEGDDPKNAAELPFGVLDTTDNNEQVIFPSPIPSDTAFSITFKQMNFEACYSYSIRSAAGEYYLPKPNGGIFDCGQGKEKGEYFIVYPEHQFKASKGWAPEGQSSVGTTYNEKTQAQGTGLPAGEYELELNKVDDRRIGTWKFCVGTGATCADFNSLTPTVTPPLPCPTEYIGANGTCTKIDTAIGPIEVDPGLFIQRILAILLGLSGGIALLLIIRAGYRLMLSQGDPEKVQQARDSLTSAIVGLLIIIFSLVILETFGVDILNLPGFTR